MNKKWPLLAITISLLILTGCDDTAEKSKESATNIKQFASEFNSLVEEMEIKEKVSEIEDKVAKGLHQIKDFSVSEIKKSTAKNSPVIGSEVGLVKANVKNIVDGDTVDVVFAGETDRVRVRLILINTPESKGEFENNPEPFALEAAEFTEKLLKNSTVWLEIGEQERDPYDRLLAYVWLDDISYELNNQKKTYESITMNELLLLEGLAHIAIYPPNTKYLDVYEKAERSAKQNKFGMWAGDTE